MNAVFRNIARRVGRARGAGLTVLVALVVLAPSIGLLWFMNRAVRNERLAVRQKLVEAYRGHLAPARERSEAHWRQIADVVEDQLDRLPAAAFFAEQVRAGLADAVVCFDAAGQVAYPNSVLPARFEVAEGPWLEAQALERSNPDAAAVAFARLAEQATEANRAARALQAQARCLARAGKQAEAVELLAVTLAGESYRQATDSQGRLLVASAELMALELMPTGTPERARSVLERLTQRLQDYSNTNLASPQRRFLMREAQRLGQVPFSTLPAEDLAARFLETGKARPGTPAWQTTALPGVWQWTSPRGRVVLLCRTENLAARMLRAMTPALPEEARVDVLAPGQEAEGSLLSLPAGPSLPGWRLALALRDQGSFDAATRERMSAEVGIGILVVGLVAVLAGAAIRLARRQTALTQLKNDLVANVTHELKTPLSSMRLLVDTLLNSARLDERTTRDYLRLIANENERLSRLIDNFLTFSRIERNKFAFDFKEVSSARIAEGAATAVRERLGAPGCRFETRIPPQLPPVVADLDAMVTVLVNLLDNAHKYSGEEKQILLSAGARNGSVVFTVEDNGIGMAPRDTERIFQRFYQVDQPLARAGGGCGLGLSIVKYIVTAHRGEVAVQSQPGRGSVFTVTLPATGFGHLPEDNA